MLIYHHFARLRNWTPRQVDELTIEEMDWLPLLEEATTDALEVLEAEHRAQNRRIQ